jgi:hypothetical protein
MRKKTSEHMGNGRDPGGVTYALLVNVEGNGDQQRKPTGRLVPTWRP